MEKGLSTRQESNPLLSDRWDVQITELLGAWEKRDEQGHFSTSYVMSEVSCVVINKER